MTNGKNCGVTNGENGCSETHPEEEEPPVEVAGALDILLDVRPTRVVERSVPMLSGGDNAGGDGAEPDKGVEARRPAGRTRERPRHREVEVERKASIPAERAK